MLFDVTVSAPGRSAERTMTRAHVRTIFRQRNGQLTSRDDIDGAMFRRAAGTTALVLFDTVPGGAGGARDYLVAPTRCS
jgi:hypothetical protein